ncbi:hypothetical protein B0I35DRAFT_417274 [Stachybotrys elegans]|uniref:Uncharacterized protein n=1 Tax=Stachybotrys elegans TaxID=80388 RepID=A0A8K0WWN4_9HYPO|nr:hypothetical protein B0I35DRAFT_417274 [Stachybotrys elegans]
MPGVNHVVLASGAVVAVSVALAAAIAVYESPELRRYADDVRRRIALALHTMGDGINPPHREPMFNRPEDADGFIESRRGQGAEPGVDADEETRRRQRDELMYWNSVRLQELETKDGASPAQVEDRPRPSHRGSSFDDFLQPDADAECGAYVYNTGTHIKEEQQDGLRHRGAGARGFSSSFMANPFADENHIWLDELDHASASQIAPGKDETMSDIYSATTRDNDEPRPLSQEPPTPLIDVNSAPAPAASQAETRSTATLERELDDDEYMTAGQEDRDEAYASIQAWAAQNSNPDFYSPLPLTPVAPVSEPELLSDGEMTPTDASSLAGSGEDIGDDAFSSRHWENGTNYDVLSESEGIATPGSWSEVGSVVSESDTPLRA